MVCVLEIIHPFHIRLTNPVFSVVLPATSLQYIRLSAEGHPSEEEIVEARPLPIPDLKDYLLLPYWQKLGIPAGEVQPPHCGFKYIFTSDSVTFDWNVVPAKSPLDNGNTSICHFQMIYNTKKPNKVEFVYATNSDAMGLNGEFATIGIQWRESMILFHSKRGIITEIQPISWWSVSVRFVHERFN